MLFYAGIPDIALFIRRWNGFMLITRSLYECMYVCKLIGETIELALISMKTKEKPKIFIFIRAKSIRLHYEFCLKIQLFHQSIKVDKLKFNGFLSAIKTIYF